MKFDRDSGEIVLSAEYLASYALSKPADPTKDSYNNMFTSAMQFPDNGERTSVHVTCKIDRVTLKLRLTSSVDRFVCGDVIIVENKKTVRKLPLRFVLSYNAEFLAESVVKAYAYCKMYNEEQIRLRLSYILLGGDDAVSFDRDYRIDELEKLTLALLSRAEYFLNDYYERMTVGASELGKLAFPYGEVRSGQHELMLGVMKTVRRGGRLVSSAPTGTGKTMATLFPSVKALGAGYIDKIFYLTGKGVTGKAAFDAMRLLGKSAPHLRCIRITAKEVCCQTGAMSDGCFICPRMNDTAADGVFKPYKLRRLEALKELLELDGMFSSGQISECAARYCLCPYELSLDLSEFCDTVICDYNYVFDSRVRFKRYFSVESSRKYVLLVDEAHNLPDRVRMSYSAEFSPRMLDEICNIPSESSTEDTELAAAIRTCSEAFDSVREMTRENMSYYSDKKGEHTAGYYRSDKVPEILLDAAASIGKLCRERSKIDGDSREAYKSLSAAAATFTASAKVGNGEFAFLAECYDDKLCCRNVCLDPSAIIRDVTSGVHSSIMFSATLDPIDYFADMLGAADAPIIKAESPFPPDNMSVTVFDGISTRLQDRRDTAYDIAEVISTVTEAKEGHYLVFFPSYKYMKTVAKALLEISPGIRAVMQKPDMSLADRDKFISAFRSQKLKSIVGLCVLGGQFSEGLDLAGDSLIGTVIVGAGLAGISSELNLISEYYDEKYGEGHKYAYDYPAINRVEQAAGRVIRTAEDRGVVVLIDDRFASPDIVKRFPEYWPRISCTSDIRTLSLILERFWNELQR